MRARFTLTDGAWGTELQSMGLAPGECADLWNLTKPHLVEAVALSYVDAGCDIILTNTFRANSIALTFLGNGHSVREINAAGARISKQAAAGRAKVFGSIGPSGKMLAAEEVTEADLVSTFREQAEALAPHVDGVVIETMSEIREAELAIEAALHAGVRVVAACLTFDTGRHKDRTMMGDTPENGAKALAAAGAHIVGANCGNGIAGFVEICRRMRSATETPIWIKANAGLPELEGDRIVYRTTPEEFAGFVPALIEAGASYIGGCCGTTPAFIREVRRQCG